MSCSTNDIRLPVLATKLCPAVLCEDMLCALYEMPHERTHGEWKQANERLRIVLNEQTLQKSRERCQQGMQ